MADIKEWFQPEPTKEAIYEGIYPVIIYQAKTGMRESEKDGQTINRKYLSITFKTIEKVPFPSGNSDNIIVEQIYYLDTQFHVNAVNGISRAVGIAKLEATEQLEGKPLIIGIMNRLS